jgi:hypothetical protein
VRSPKLDAGASFEYSFRRLKRYCPHHEGHEDFAYAQLLSTFVVFVVFVAFVMKNT